MEVCGNISDQEVVDGYPELKGLAELIGNQTVEQIKKETVFKAKTYQRRTTEDTAQD